MRTAALLVAFATALPAAFAAPVLPVSGAIGAAIGETSNGVPFASSDETPGVGKAAPIVPIIEGANGVPIATTKVVPAADQPEPVDVLDSFRQLLLEMPQERLPDLAKAIAGIFAQLAAGHDNPLGIQKRQEGAAGVPYHVSSIAEWQQTGSLWSPASSSG